MTKFIASAALLLSIFAAPVHAITNNWVEDFEHPYVGLVVFYDSKGEFIWRCSGSLIGPQTFLTAGHCADTAEGAVSARVYFQQDAGANFDPGLGYDPKTGYPIKCLDTSLCVEAHELHNYGFANFAGFPNTHDVGLVILDDEVRHLGFGVLPKAGQLDGLATARGQKNTVFTVSGYGLTLRTQEHSALANISFRERLMAQSTLVNLNSALNDGFNLQTQGNGNGRGGTCSGDSGGPVFLGAWSSNLIVAVTSFGLNALCRGTDFGYRIDRVEVLDWINKNRHPDDLK
jgi:hypothetical protein